MTNNMHDHSSELPSVDAAHITPPEGLVRVTSIIDQISIWCGKAVAWLIFPMVGSLVFEVICRYFFNAPTIWASDMSTIFYGAFYMLGAGYTLQRQQHIRTDFLYEKWTTRTKGIVDSVLYITLYFPGLGMFLWIGSQYAFRSVLQQERIINSPWMPYIWPLKLAIPVATILLLLQGISELLKSLYAAYSGCDLHEETDSVET